MRFGVVQTFSPFKPKAIPSFRPSCTQDVVGILRLISFGWTSHKSRKYLQIYDAYIY